MSYQCNKHGWSHVNFSCPKCAEDGQCKECGNPGSHFCPGSAKLAQPGMFDARTLIAKGRMMDPMLTEENEELEQCIQDLGYNYEGADKVLEWANKKFAGKLAEAIAELRAARDEIQFISDAFAAWCVDLDRFVRHVKRIDAFLARLEGGAKGDGG